MAGKGGTKYERKIRDILVKHGIIKKGSAVGGFNARSRDLHFEIGGSSFYLEIKKDFGKGVNKADYGQIELKYDLESKKFRFTDNPRVSKKKRDLFEKSGFLDKINNSWRKVPNRYKNIKDFTLEHKSQDQRNFQSVYHEYPIQFIHEYYAIENCFYIQIGNGGGFFYMDDDPANLNVDRLNGISYFRARIKTRSSKRPNQYGFLVAIKLKNLEPSSYDLENCSKIPPIKPSYNVTCPKCQNRKWW